MLEGAVIAESLRAGTSLDGLELVIHKISRGPAASAAEYQPKTWTLIEFSADTDPDALAERFAAVLDGPGWYVDFRTETTTYVAYPGRVFRYRRGDPAGREEARAYGRIAGVPEPQLDWAG